MREAAIVAAGGIGFPALEAAIATRFLGDALEPSLRRTAMASLGHLGAQSAAPRLVELLAGGDEDAAVSLTALTEIRSLLAVEPAVRLLENEPSRQVRIAAVRYLAELGREEVLPFLRRMAREADAELRLVASFASRALKAERNKDAGDRILVALTEKDRAVRSALARRLRTLPVDDVLEQARMLLADEAEGVVQVIGEVRSPKVTTFLLEVAQDAGVPMAVRARALGSIEADEPWERESLLKIVTDAAQPETLRAAAAQAIGAFASVDEILRSMSPVSDDGSALVRGAVIWALQVAARPEELSQSERAQCERLLSKMLTDPEVAVRRRAAYVAGNLRLSALAPVLVQLVKSEPERPDLRIAGLTGLAELGAKGSLDAVVALTAQEEDPRVLSAASLTLAALREAHARVPADLGALHDKILWSMRGDDPALAESMVRLAGLSAGALPASRLVELARSGAPRVREVALVSLGRLRAEEGLEPLLAALHDADDGLQEMATEALERLGGKRALAGLLEYVSGEADEAARARLAARLKLPPEEREHYLPLLDAALSH
ncbi:MAG: HEAT repeat domain-containing protein, partial [Deltaproteobacteria bacterium]|nr:HEAT repeat domain-containing protein [Deltaproteobacteria bacterium]